LSLPNPILALDLPGHGTSPEPAEPGFDGLVRDVEDALVEARLSRLHLLGHSLGAAVGAALAGAGGLDVRSLCLLAPAGLGPRINGEFIEGFCAAETEPALRAWLTVLVHDSAALPGALVRATMRARESGDLAGAQKRVAAALFPNGTQIFSVRAALQRFAGPTRAIFGREDAIIPPHHGEALPAAAALHRLERVGHLPQLEATQLVARLAMETVRSAG
jgi:pyruvate dehydrogenase E2 component (dihydrolipoamide acetyltransferase)